MSLRIATRGSPLALAQAEYVRGSLTRLHDDLAAPGAVEIVVVKTTGDKVQDRPLAEIGGKGLFAKEIEEALLARQADMAVHSLKDMETMLPDGLVIACYPPREDPRDVWIARGGAQITALAPGASVGTASLRRGAQILGRRPDLRVKPLRGNVQTRLRKLAAGEADATLLALAGLSRLGMTGEAGGMVLDPDELLPAIGQGALGVECRAADERVRAMLAPLNDPNTEAAVRAERALLAALDGNCRTPIGGLAEIDGNGGLRLRALVAAPDGSIVHRVERFGTMADGVRLGRDAGSALRTEADPNLFD